METLFIYIIRFFKNNLKFIVIIFSYFLIFETPRSRIVIKKKKKKKKKKKNILSIIYLLTLLVLLFQGDHINLIMSLKPSINSSDDSMTK